MVINEESTDTLLNIAWFVITFYKFYLALLGCWLDLQGRKVHRDRRLYDTESWNYKPTIQMVFYNKTKYQLLIIMSDRERLVECGN